MTEVRTCQNCKQEFTIAPEDFDFYKKVKVPPPTFCWKCRFQRRLTYRNERNPFWATSGKSGKRILSIFPPEAGVTVYDEKEWRSDDWDGMDYGRDYDFSRPFFEQIHELAKTVPRFGPHTEDNVNCEYLVNTGWSKNCYLVCNTSYAEDCAYGNAMDYCKSSFDCSHVTKCERCYGCFWTRESYQTHFSTRSISNASSWCLFGCKGMTDCFGCVNMMNKSHYIFNQPYSREEYEAKIGAMKLNTWSGLQKAKAEAFAFAAKFPVAYLNGVLNDNVTGEYVSESKNVQYGYLVNGGRDLKYVQYLQIPGAEDSQDLTIWGEKHILGYENATSGLGVSNCQFLEGCWAEVFDSQYCIACRNISNCFGCVGLKKKQCCIFNKQYSKGEYEKLKAKIIAHMNAMPFVDKAGRVYKYGEFFPAEHALCGYNISLANEHFPLTKEEALAQGYLWTDMKYGDHKVTVMPDKIPDAIEDVPDTFTKEILECMQCKKAFRVVPMELEFLKAVKIPVPRTCGDCRHSERISRRAKAFLYHQTCECAGAKSSNGVYANFTKHIHGDVPCPEEFETSHDKSRPEIVYCLKCFWAEVG
ncbi:MAG: hypothetical protein HYY10_04160 [Candidatus Liptonbacteria bacterium]|nr:hypothetical protein [Candidatus Liptonbacteria bacterium]